MSYDETTLRIYQAREGEHNPKPNRQKKYIPASAKKRKYPTRV